MPCEIFDPWNPRQFGLVQRPTRHDDKTRLEHITAIGSDGPASGFLIPAGLIDFRLEAGPFVKIVVLADPLSVRKDLRRKGVAFLRDVVELFEQRQIEITLDVT